MLNHILWSTPLHAGVAQRTVSYAYALRSGKVSEPVSDART